MKRRKRRPRDSDNEELLWSFRGPGRCQLCNRLCRNREAAHLRAKGMGGGWRLDHELNLISLGGPWDCACHAKQHGGSIAKETLYEKVAEREGLTVEELKARLDELQRSRCECGKQKRPTRERCDSCWEKDE